MIKITQVKIVDGNKTWKSAKDVVDLVRRGCAIPRGDIGAYLVGVFACQPLTDDSKRYDLSDEKQWRHCIYKEQWMAALYGKDIFTDEEKSLVLAGAALLKDHKHGWGNKASNQPHVRKLLASWNSFRIQES